MGYILPIPHYQYQDYQGRVAAASYSNYARIASAREVSFDSVLREKTADKNRQKHTQSGRTFRAQLAQASMEGTLFDERI